MRSDGSKQQSCSPATITRTLDFTWRVLKSRWFALAAGLWIESVAGAAYTFGSYSQSLKLALGYDQKRLDTLAFFKAIGGNVGVVPGLLYDVVPPWAVLVGGAAENAFGYSMLWLSVTGRISPPAFWQMCIYICLASNSNTFFSTACVVTNVKNFPTKRGIVIGLLKGFLGLSGAIFTQVNFALYPNDPSAYLSLIAWLPAAVSLLFMAFIRVVPPTEGDSANFSLFSTIAACLAAYLTFVIVTENLVPFRTWWSLVVCLLILVFFLLLFVVVIKAELKDYYEALTISPARGKDSVTKPLLGEQETYPTWPPDSGRNFETGPDEYLAGDIHVNIERSPSSHPEVDSSKRRTLLSQQSEGPLYDDPAAVARVEDTDRYPQRGEEHSLCQALSSLDFWLLVVIMFCSMGSGTTAIDNMGQIGASLGYTQVEINTFISLISIWNFLGRFGAGAISEFLLHSRGFARPFCLAFFLALMCIGHLIMALAVTGSLYMGSIILGVCYGAQWSLMPAITSEIFGLRSFGLLYNTITIASPVAAYILSVQVAGYFYDKEAQKQHNVTTSTRWHPSLISNHSDESLLCYGPTCFRTTFIILGFVCVFGCGICLWLFVRTKRFYYQLFERLCKSD